MTKRTRTSLEILQAAALMGLLGNILLRQTPWGLNAFLFVTAFVAALLGLMRRWRPELLTKSTIALGGAMVFFGSMFLIRDAIELRIADTLAIIVLMGATILINFDIKAHIAGVVHYAAGSIWAGLTSIFGPFILLGTDIDWKTMPGNNLSRTLFAVMRGLAIAIPLLLIFGGLLVAADAAFEGLVNRALNFEIDTVVSHVVLTSVFAWLTAGYFRGMLASDSIPTPAPAVANAPSEPAAADDSTSLSVVAKMAAEPVDNPSVLPDNATILEHINRSDPPDTGQAEPKKTVDWQNFDSSKIPTVFTLGTIETVLIIGLLDLLFLTFVIVQVPYLFGGMDLVQNTPDFKLAEYARRGFGELVAVAALVLPMLLLSHWLLRRDTGRPEKIFRILAGIQIALLFVMMASAAQRLFLLTGALGYGMTTVRFYPMVFMTWLAIVFVWFAATVFRDRRNHFAWGALWAAIAILGVTNLMNPHSFIVGHNVILTQQGRDFDAHYNSDPDLSDDAIPELIKALPGLSGEDICRVKRRLHDRLNEAAKESDLRSWNYSRSRAHALLQENHLLIDEASPCHEFMDPKYPEHSGAAE